MPPPSRSPLYTIIKLVDKIEWAEDIRAGKLRAGTLQGYRSYKDLNGEARGDKHEGISAWIPSSDRGRIEIDGRQVPAFKDLALTVDTTILNCNAFCAYALKEQPQELSLDEFREGLRLHRKCFGLGGFAVVVTDFEAFFERVKTAARKLGVEQMSSQFVEYFDETTHCGEVRPGFAKRSLYKHQNEWRILFKFPGEPMDPRVIEVGDLADIVVITPTDQLDDLIKVREE
jgi:hypothetical protein